MKRRRVDWLITAIMAGLLWAIFYAPHLAPYFVVAWLVAAIRR
jgi:hypothetical protein